LSSKALLFEKRSKNFCLLMRVVRHHQPPIIKSFLVLFFKKELLSSLPFTPRNPKIGHRVSGQGGGTPWLRYSSGK
jgi:hypothetical protein